MKATRTLLRGLEVLEALAHADGPLGPTRAAELVGLDKATAARLLSTLCEAGYARQVGAGAYVLTSRVLTLAGGIGSELDVLEVARPHLLNLRDETRETVHLGVRDGTRVVYIDKIEGTQPVRLVSAIGQSMPMHTTALGKVALAWMPERERDELIATLPLTARTEHSIVDRDELRREILLTRERGYSVDDLENEDHALCVGAPLIGPAGEVVAMISVSGPSYRLTGKEEQLGDACRRSATRISADLGSLIPTALRSGGVAALPS